MSIFSPETTRLSTAVNDFHHARRKAALERVMSFLSGRSTDLLSYNEVRKKFRTIESARRTLEDIPIEKIVGSVGRYTDFSRSFLPRQSSDLPRWTSVSLGMATMQGLPPIETYKVGDAYFILDGHHRVSVAKEIGSKSIEGYVTPVFTRVPLSPGDSPDDLILKAEYDDFLNKTRLDDLRPDANLLVTAPGQYQKLLEHIAVHQYFMGEKHHHAIEYKDAVAEWYDKVYLPITELIRARNLLRDFPNRTEADLYLWIMDHRTEVGGGELGWEVRPERAAADLVRRYSPTLGRFLPRLRKKVIDLLVPDTLEAGPDPGVWRAEHSTPHRGDRLFDDILVTVPGIAGTWHVVEMAIEIARREEARLTGLHVVANADMQSSEEVQAVRAEFERRAAPLGSACRFIVEVGKVAEVVNARSTWVDLVIFRMNYPPPDQPLLRLRSGARYLIRRASAPVFSAPDAPFHLDSALLAYGPGRKADEALFVATYLAGRWKIPLTVLTVKPKSGPSGDLDRARTYLNEHGVQAEFVEVEGEMGKDAARAIVLQAEAVRADFLIMGGYESGPLRESLFGSTVDRVLRTTRRAVLICR